ncbi:MAG TPA: S8 family serine peptidase [Bryobacteraceae bacterium]|nr:S8 family serine peptidase [Bryobacteraceae bacterium]
MNVQGKPNQQPLRFPLRAPRIPSPEPIVQIEIAQGVNDLAAMPRDFAAAFESLTAIEGRVSAQMIEVFTLLTSLGARNIYNAFGPPPLGLDEVLSAEEKVSRGRLFHVVFAPGTDLKSMSREILLRSNKLVTRAAALPADSPPHLPDDPLVGTSDHDVDKQWYLFRCRAPRAWELATGSGVVIADVDWGCRITHQDLTNIEPRKAYNSHDGSNDVTHGKHVSHGTAVLGQAGAARNHLGIVGFAPNAALWPIQAVSSSIDKRMPGTAWARGIDYVLASRDPRRKVVIIENQSGRGRNIEQEYALNLAIQQGIAHGLVIVVAAGNGGADVSLDDHNHKIPYTGSILAGSTDYHPYLNVRACSSNFGDRLTVSAPGDGAHDVTCNSTNDASYRSGFGGTSGAAGKVGGVCAQILEIDPSLTHREVKQILEITGDDVVTPTSRPAGVFLDAYPAVRMAQYQSQRTTEAANSRRSRGHSAGQGQVSAGSEAGIGSER